MQGGHYIHMSPLFTIGNRVYSNPHTVGSNPTPSDSLSPPDFA